MVINEFRVQAGASPSAALPALVGLGYGFDPSLTGADARGPLRHPAGPVQEPGRLPRLCGRSLPGPLGHGPGGRPTVAFAPSSADLLGELRY